MADRQANASRGVALKLERYLADNVGASRTEFLAGLNKLEQELLQGCAVPKLQLEIRRRCAELYCSHCIEKRADWRSVCESLQKLDGLGYSNVERRAHFAVLLGRYAASVQEARIAAQSRARDTLQRVRCLTRSNPMRTHLEGLLTPMIEDD